MREATSRGDYYAVDDFCDSLGFMAVGTGKKLF
jgi:hypothetical protein